MKRWYDRKVWIFSLLLVLAGVATPVWAQTPSPTLANFLQSRNWWEDAGTTSSTRPYGIVYLFKGVSQGNGFYSGERVAVSGFPEFGRRLGIAYYPFEYQGHYGVYVDRGYDPSTSGSLAMTSSPKCSKSTARMPSEGCRPSAGPARARPIHPQRSGSCILSSGCEKSAVRR